MGAIFCTRAATVNDAGFVIGADHPQAKLSDEDVALIHDLRAAGLSYGQIAQKFDDWPRVSKTMVYYVCTARRRGQATMGHRRVRLRAFTAADMDEFT